ncbi:MAG: selenoneine synthase SenA [Vulcanimicrobiaceae bacterium]
MMERELRDARARTLTYVADLRDDQFFVPELPTINPLLWELGHVAYFAEFWTLRHLGGHAPMLHNADALYDSAAIAHDDRWALPLPSRTPTLAFLDAQLTATIALPTQIESDDRLRYFYGLILGHEDMHGEALLYTRSTLGYTRPHVPALRAPILESQVSGDASIPGGRYRIGSTRGDGFVFDNEKWAHDVEVDDFAIARTCVTNEEFAAFVRDGGYTDERLWSVAGWQWRTSESATMPLCWRNADCEPLGFERRAFDHWHALAPNGPVTQISAYEADAFARWAQRRLPTEVEWEIAASGKERRRYPWGDHAPTADCGNLDLWYGDVVDVHAFACGDTPEGIRQMLGNVWEWTASPFTPYPGFSVDPYKEYSAPWFRTHRVLRGGAWSTRARLVHNRWRNFYLPHRRDIFTGFRTCAR